MWGDRQTLWGDRHRFARTGRPAVTDCKRYRPTRRFRVTRVLVGGYGAEPRRPVTPTRGAAPPGARDLGAGDVDVRRAELGADRAHHAGAVQVGEEQQVLLGADVDV